jgi:type VI secretion system protein ImpL
VIGALGGYDYRAQKATAAMLDASAPAGQAAGNGAPANQPVKLEVGYNAPKTYLMLHEQKRMDEPQLIDQIRATGGPIWKASVASIVEEIMSVAESWWLFMSARSRRATCH